MTEETRKAIEDIRVNWAIADRERDQNLTVPEDVKAYYNISYGPYGEENLLDIYVEQCVNSIQPTIVNIHGGAWVYGNKEIYRFYCMSLAQRGFTVVNLNYRVAPENHFPAPLEDVNRVMEFIVDKGMDYCIDKDNLILVGDSAGAQITSHYAAFLSNKEYGSLFNMVRPEVTVKAIALNCGVYDAKHMCSDGGLDQMFMAYLGMDDVVEDQMLLAQLDVCGAIDANYPPTYVMSAYEDFLYAKAEPMYQLLKERNVPAVMRIYGSEGKTEIGHIFHVNCNLAEAQLCNDDECEFFKKSIR